MHPDLLSHPRAELITHSKWFHLLITTNLILCIGIPITAQGFGPRSADGRLVRTHPPDIYLPAANVVAEVQSPHSGAQHILGRLKEGIEGIFNAPSRKPISTASMVHTLLAVCTITDFDAASKIKTERRSEYRKTGEHIIHDDPYGTTRTIEDFSWVSVAHQFASSDGEAHALVEIKDAETGLVLDRVEVDGEYHDQSESSPPMSVDRLRAYVADALLYNIVARYKTEADSLWVRLPKDKLKNVSDQLAASNWNSALELLRALPAFKTSQDEAYREYSFGLAYEGLAYEQRDASQALSLLRQAIAAYANTAQRKADESVFVEARRRAMASATEFEQFLNKAAAFEARKKKVS